MQVEKMDEVQLLSLTRSNIIVSLYVCMCPNSRREFCALDSESGTVHVRSSEQKQITNEDHMLLHFLDTMPDY